MKKSGDRGYGMYTSGAKHFVGHKEQKAPADTFHADQSSVPVGAAARFKGLKHTPAGRKGVKDIGVTPGKKK